MGEERRRGGLLVTDVKLTQTICVVNGNSLGILDKLYTVTLH